MGMMSSSRKRRVTGSVEPLSTRQIGDERWWVIASAYFDHNLRRVASRSQADNWLVVSLLYLRGDAPHWFCEIDTRFSLMAEGRDRPRCLRVVDLIGKEQKRWTTAFGIEFPEYGARSSQVREPGVPRITPTWLEVVRRQIVFDSELRVLRDTDRTREVRLAIALAHPPQLPAHSHCMIRTRFGFRAVGHGVERALKPCRAIARLQKQWQDTDGASFCVPGRVRPHLVPVYAKTPRLVRAHGKRSNPDRQVEVGQVYKALEVVARVWDEYVRDPDRTRVRAFGISSLGAAAAAAAHTINALRRAAEERRRARHVLNQSDYERILQALDVGSFTDLHPYLDGVLRGSPCYPAEARTLGEPSAARTVLAFIEHVLDPDALTRFAPAGAAHRGDGRPRLTPTLLRRVGDALGHGLGGGQRRRARAVGFDSRLVRLTSAIIAQRHHEPERTLRRTLVRPALAGKLAGPIFLLDEAAAKNRRDRRPRP
jgi:hypothetical protein